MSVTVRLSLFGKKNYPVYRIVVAETRSKRNGPALDILGNYNPNLDPPSFNLDRKLLEEWIKKGAIVSSGLRKLLKKEGKK